MNLREFVNRNRGEDKNISTYAHVVREERYFCAVLYHCMLTDQNGMQRFLQLCGVDRKGAARCGVRGVYVEYAMARDLWEKLGSHPKEGKRRANYLKYEYIKSMLDWSPLTEEDEGILQDGEDAGQSIVKFNRHFCTKQDISKAEREAPSQLERISKTDIETPAHWRIATFCKDASRYGIYKKHFVETACKMKWAFNVKPDIVIELDNEEVVCIVAKLESSEDSYANKENRDAIKMALEADADHFLEGFSRQCAIQCFLMRELLGFKQAHMVFLSKTGRKNASHGKDVTPISWPEAYGCFSDMDSRALREAQYRIDDLVGGKGRKGESR